MAGTAPHKIAQIDGHAAKGSPTPTTATPMMVQYMALKEKAADCLLFYRMGDFFELFFDDAKQASETLNIALTARGAHSGDPIPMCGVPVHSAEGYLAKLIKAGHRVAIAEQTETPEQAKARGGYKALVARDIVRYVTAGTLTEDSLLDSRASNMLAAICDVGGEIGIAAADISTGQFELLTASAQSAGAQLARLNPSELIVPDGFKSAWTDAITRPKAEFDSGGGVEALKSLFAAAPADFSRAEYGAAGGLIAYLAHVGQGNMPYLMPPVRRGIAEHMAIDQATRDSLEIIAAQRGGRAGSLLQEVDRTVTGAGARMLAADLAAPLLDRGDIEVAACLGGLVP